MINLRPSEYPKDQKYSDILELFDFDFALIRSGLSLLHISVFTPFTDSIKNSNVVLPEERSCSSKNSSNS